MRRGFPIIISGPAGSGKTSICQRIVKEVHKVKYSVSATTRPKRPGERNGRDYHFLEERTFKQWIRAGRFCEWAKVHDHYYGTPRDFMEKALSSGKEVILDVDLQGRRAIRKKYPEGVYILLFPPSCVDLKKRLRKRGTETKESLKKRLQGVEREMKGFEKFDYLVINRSLKKAVEAVRTIISSERLRGIHDEQFNALKVEWKKKMGVGL